MLVALGLGAALQAGEKKIALTFDDLPTAGRLGFWTAREVSSMILRTLERHSIKAAGFVVEEKIDEDASRYIILEDWVTRGHALGNHTYGHVDLHQLSAEDFLHHVADGQKYLWRVSKVHRLNFRYLRFPYLHEGDTPGKKKDVAKALYNGGYEVAPVTVLTSDLSFNDLYIEYERDTERLARLKNVYLEHIGATLDYAESQSQKVFGRNIHHLLWLHCGIATASFLEDLVQMLRTRGYEFVSFPEALSDPAFQRTKGISPETYVGPESLSFVDRMAATRGVSYDPLHARLSKADIEARLPEPQGTPVPVSNSVRPGTNF